VSVDQWTAGGWAAAASWATVIVAATAIWVAREQLQEAQHLRREQAKPYVVAYMDAQDNRPHIIKLVLKNFGATAAYDVRLTIDPNPTSSRGGKSLELRLPDVIPILVPGQQWETIWDSSVDRIGTIPSPPKRYDAVVKYRDPNGMPDQEEQTATVLDWSPYEQRQYMPTHSTHEVAGALRDIKDLLKGWAGTTGGMSVWTRDGHEQDRAVRARIIEHEEYLERLATTWPPSGEPASDDPPSQMDAEP